ncbi:ATP-binding protein [Streptacidiphilus monticola]|uniref:ATP-binding protein n=1 Tax=Streptacidiphilus monticola TaxID=2161674 RepID=A0ABW1G8K0_9ACTN
MPRRGNLPAEATSFIGRDAELRLAARLLTEARLITVVGPGGVGKSRLVLRAGAEARFPDGVWLAQLAPVTEASLLGHVLVEALGLVDGTAREPLAVLTDALRDQELLLVLDGCEHLLPEAAALVAALLAAAPGLRVLATSRQPLGAPGEHLLPLSPLPSDGPDTEAVRLFLQRAAAVVPDFALTEQNRAQIVSLCHRLDGIPLAIELAAGRLRALSLQQILDRLDDRFRLLAAPSRLALPRHQTLRMAVGWSHELCTPQERLLWARLSAFAGPFDLEAVEYVCAGGTLPAVEILDVLSELVDKSIVIHEDDPDYGPHYRMLDTLREYGAEWLRSSGEQHRLQRRHRDWYLGLASWGELEWFSPRQEETRRRAERAHANLRAALEFSLTEPGEEESGLLLAATLWYFWVGCGHLGEGRHWLDRALQLAPGATAAHTKALGVTGYVATLQGDLAHAAVRLEECRELALANGDDRALAYAVHRQGCAALIGDDLPRAATLFEEAVWLYEQVGELNSNVLMAMFELGLTRILLGDLEPAGALMDKVRHTCEDFGEQWAYAYGLYALSMLSRHRGELGTARRLIRECVRINLRFRDLVGLALGLEMAALLATEPSPDGRAADLREASRLNGAAHGVWQHVGPALFGSRTFRSAHAESRLRVSAELPEAVAAEAFEEGRQLTLDQAAALVLAWDESGLAPGPGNGGAPAARRATGAPREPLAGQRE